MAANELGGFFVSLGLKTDKESFNLGKKSTEEVANNIQRLVGVVRNAGPIVAAGIGTMFATATASGKIETQSLKTAAAMGMSVEKLNAWKIAAKMAQTDANGLTNEIKALDEKMTLWERGKAPDSVSNAFGQLRLYASEVNSAFEDISIENFKDMSADSRTKTVFRMATAMTDTKKAATLVKDILGSAGEDFYNYMIVNKTTVDEMFKKGEGLNYVGDEEAKKAMDFNTQLNGTIEGFKSIAQLIGSDMGESFTPMLEQLNKFMSDNKDAIKEKIGIVADGFKNVSENIQPLIGKGLEKASDAIDVMSKALKDLMGSPELKDLGETLKKVFGDIAGALGPAFTAAINNGVVLIKDLAAALKTLLTGDWKKTGENLKKFFGDFGKDISEVSTIVGQAVIGDTTSAGILSDNSAMGTVKGVATMVTRTPEQKQNLKNAATLQFDIQSAIDKIRGEKFQWYDFLNPRKDTRLTIDDLDGDTKKMLEQWVQGKGKLDAFTGLKINDGIIKPNGSVVSVAPDDWVVAFRDAADLASAFIPQSYGNTNNVSAPQSFVINQSFTISGNNALMPQTIRQQAYNGTQSALMEAINRSQDRLQMMSGLR